MRPATASFVSGGSAWWPSSSRLASRCARRSSPASRRCSGTSSPRISSARSTRAHAATAACAERRRFASSKLTRRLTPARTSRRWRSCSQSRRGALGAHLRRASRGSPRPRGHDAGHAAHLAGLGGDAEPVRRADERHRGLGRGARDLERRGSAGLAQRAGGEERARARSAARSAREPVVSLFGQPAHGPAALVEQAGLAREGLAALDHAHGVVAAVAARRTPCTCTSSGRTP